MARCNHGDAALHWLNFWHDNFVNEGRGTLHDAHRVGVSTLLNQPFLQPARKTCDDFGEVMQLDAGFGALNAVFEMLVQQRGQVLYPAPAVPERWKNVRAERIGCEGAVQLNLVIAMANAKASR